MAYTYMQAIGVGFPDVQCHSFGNENLYENIFWDAGAPLPSKETLDTWMASNSELLNPTLRKVTVLAFRNRFTKAEKIKIDMASIDNPALAIDHPQRVLAAAIRVDSKDTDNATFIDLNRADTRAGVIALETYGLLATGRALVILDSEILEHEIPK